MRSRPVVLPIVLGVGLVVSWLLWPTGGGFERIDGQAFGTGYQITFAEGPGRDDVRRVVDRELARIDALASTWRDDSELMRYNRADDPEAFVLSPELSALIEQAEQIGSQIGGAFSPRPDGGLIDLSGIAKGYAVDRVVELLQRDFGVSDCLVDIGGEVRAVGDGPSGDGWRVGVYVPQSAGIIDAPVVQLRDTSLATSGAYFKGDHILDPATGRPADHGVLSVSVVHANCATADALATAMYVMGPERGLAWAKTHDVQVIFLMKDGTQRASLIKK